MLPTIEQSPLIGSKRSEIIQQYLATTDIRVSPRPDLKIMTPGSAGTVVIPAFNEAGDICHTLESIVCSGNLDALVIDNNSTDGTADVVRSYAQKSSAPISVIDCPTQGYGPTRRTGFNQVLANYLFHHPYADKKHFMIMMDADSQFCPDWIVYHKQLVSQEFSAIGVTYRFPAAIDKTIEQYSGLPDYLYSIARLSNELTHEGIAKIQTAAQGGAVEVAAFAAIDRDVLLKHETRGSDRIIGTKVQQLGMKVGFNPAVNVHDARRFLYELTAGLACLQSYGTDPGEVRKKQMAMSAQDIDLALQNTTPSDYIKYHYQRLQSFVRRNIVEPILQQEISGDPLDTYVASLGSPIDVTADTAVTQLSDLFIQQDSMLTRIYSSNS